MTGEFGHRLAARYRELGIGGCVYLVFYYIGLCFFLYQTAEVMGVFSPVNYPFYLMIILLAHFLTLWTLTPAAFWISILTLTMETAFYGPITFLIMIVETFLGLLFKGSVLSQSMFGMASLLLYLLASGMFFFLKRKAFGIKNGGQARFRRTFFYQKGDGSRGRHLNQREARHKGDSVRNPARRAARDEDEKYAQQAALYRDYEMVYLQNGAENGWSMSPNLYARCRSCGYYMWLDPGEDDDCLCGNLKKESGWLSSRLGEEAMDLYCKTPRKR